MLLGAHLEPSIEVLETYEYVVLLGRPCSTGEQGADEMDIEPPCWQTFTVRPELDTKHKAALLSLVYARTAFTKRQKLLRG